jgi:hypothetical protein
MSDIKKIMTTRPAISPTINLNVIIGSSIASPSGQLRKMPFTVDMIRDPTRPTKKTCR